MTEAVGFDPKYNKYLTIGDAKGNYNGQVDNEKEAEVSAEEFCKDNPPEECDKFLKYLGTFGYIPKEIKIRNLLALSYGWRNKDIDSLVKEISKITESKDKAIDILYALVISGTSKPNEARKHIEALKKATGNFAKRVFNVLPSLLLDSAIKPQDILAVVKSITVYRFYEHNLEEIIRNRIKKEPDGRKLAVIIYPHPRTDPYGAFNSDKNIFDDLIKKGYKVVYHEVKTDKEFYASLKAATSLQKANALVIGGHGNKTLTNFGAKSREDHEKEEYLLDLSDKDEMIKNNLGGCLEDGGKVFLFSCSTGDGKTEEVNVANMLREVFPRAGKISALQLPNGIKKFTFDENGDIKDFVPRYRFGEQNVPYDSATDAGIDLIINDLKCPPTKEIDLVFWGKIKWPVEIEYKDEYVSALVDVINSYPPIPGISNRAVQTILCMYREGDKNIRCKIISSLVKLLDEEGSVGEVAKLVLIYAELDAVPALVEHLQLSKKPLKLLKIIAERTNSTLYELIAVNWKQEYVINCPEVAYALGVTKREEFLPQLQEAAFNADNPASEEAELALLYIDKETALPNLISELQYSKKPLETLKKLAEMGNTSVDLLIAQYWQEDYAINYPEVVRALAKESNKTFMPQIVAAALDKNNPAQTEAECLIVENGTLDTVLVPLVKELQFSDRPLKLLRLISKKHFMGLDSLIASYWKKEYKLNLPEVITALAKKRPKEFLPQFTAMYIADTYSTELTFLIERVLVENGALDAVLAPLVKELQFSDNPLRLLEIISVKQGIYLDILITSYWKPEYKITCPEVVIAIRNRQKWEFAPQMIEAALDENNSARSEAVAFFSDPNINEFTLRDILGNYVKDENNARRLLGFYLTCLPDNLSDNYAWWSTAQNVLEKELCASGSAVTPINDSLYLAAAGKLLINNNSACIETPVSERIFVTAIDGSNEAYSILVALGVKFALHREKFEKVLLDKETDRKRRILAARLLGEIGSKDSNEVLEDILGVGLFNLRDDDEELCAVALESLNKIREASYE